MRATLISPVRIPFNLPKYRLLANNLAWQAIIKEEQPKLQGLTQQFAQLSSATLGNYGWGKSRREVYQINDSGWFFADHYLLRLTSNNPETDLHIDALARDQLNNLSTHSFRWQCDIINNSLAILLLEFETEQAEQLLTFTHHKPDNWQRFKDLALAKFSSPESSFIDVLTSALRLIDQTLVKRMLAIDPDFTNDAQFYLPKPLTNIANRPDNRYLGNKYDLNNLFTQQHPVYDQFLQPLWSHDIYGFTEQECTTLAEPHGELLEPVLGEPQMNALRQQQNCFGWGASSLLLKQSNKRTHKQWYDANGVMQYYYSCFDIADTALPLQIATLQKLSSENQHKKVLAQAQQLRTGLHTLIRDYNDLLLHSASGAYDGLKGYHKSWRVEQLTDNIKEKLTMLDQLTKESSDWLNKKTEATVQTILFFITLLGLVSLTTSVHAYLAGGYEVRLNDPLPQLALSIGKGDVIIFSAIGIGFLLLAYFLLHKLRNR